MQLLQDELDEVDEVDEVDVLMITSDASSCSTTSAISNVCALRLASAAVMFLSLSGGLAVECAPPSGTTSLTLGEERGNLQYDAWCIQFVPG